jgi:hypothetical protein
MKKRVQEKNYIIFNRAIGKQYVGKTRNLDQRYSDHVSKLRAGRHENPDLQRDWDHYGEESFIWVDVLLRAGEIRPDLLEDLLIDTLRTLDPALGYNRRTSRGWGPHSRLRDLERKLIRSGKFKLIPGVKLDDPIQEGHLKAVLKGHGKVQQEQAEEADCENEWETLEEAQRASDPQQDPDESVAGDQPQEEAEQEER